MTIHVVCLDGTDEQKPQANITNIAKIFDAMGGDVVDGGYGSWETTLTENSTLIQSGKYLPGVGTQGDPVLKVLGTLFGINIATQIVRGYTFLSRNYVEDDDIIITGFSRGAAAARALAGFIAIQGLLKPDNYDPTDKTSAYLRAIAAWYHYRKDQPDLADQSRLLSIAIKSGRIIPTLNESDYIPVPVIKAVGVFDTANALGLPNLFAKEKPFYDFSIANTVLHPKISYGFQALAADEIRPEFLAILWEDREGVIQEVFPGSHSNIGGGYPETGLSDIPLPWMLENLEPLGLRYDIGNIIPPLNPNPLDTARNEAANLPWKLLPQTVNRNFPLSSDGRETCPPNKVIAERWGHIVQVLPGPVIGPYRSKATEGGRPLYNPMP